jgi:uncharacterized lipoprotein NlpE involved in copper resistance
MRPTSLALAVAALTLTGCQNRQDKIVAAQKEYDQAAQQFRTNCTTETLRMPARLSFKCEGEQKRMNDAYARLQSEKQKP